jgi:hypothetical protein
MQPYVYNASVGCYVPTTWLNILQYSRHNVPATLEPKMEGPSRLPSRA